MRVRKWSLMEKFLLLQGSSADKKVEIDWKDPFLQYIKSLKVWDQYEAMDKVIKEKQNGEILKSVEILDPSSDKGWIFGNYRFSKLISHPLYIVQLIIIS